MSFVSLLLWGWVFGGLGTLIALPCSLLVKAMLIDPDPDARWINALISSRSFEHEDSKNEEDAGKAGDADDARDADSTPQHEPTDESESEGSEDERRPARE
jgi:hypothetical protein